jgi:hypothetical protein
MRSNRRLIYLAVSVCLANFDVTLSGCGSSSAGSNAGSAGVASIAGSGGAGRAGSSAVGGGGSSDTNQVAGKDSVRGRSAAGSGGSQPIGASGDGWFCTVAHNGDCSCIKKTNQPVTGDSCTDESKIGCCFVFKLSGVGDACQCHTTNEYPCDQLVQASKGTIVATCPPD